MYIFILDFLYIFMILPYFFVFHKNGFLNISIYQYSQRIFEIKNVNLRKNHFYCTIYRYRHYKRKTRSRQGKTKACFCFYEPKEKVTFSTAESLVQQGYFKAKTAWAMCLPCLSCFEPLERYGVWRKAACLFSA